MEASSSRQSEVVGCRANLPGFGHVNREFAESVEAAHIRPK
jgi:hypothetical protein